MKHASGSTVLLVALALVTSCGGGDGDSGGSGEAPPAARFEACEDGLTVADNETGLLWERKTDALEGITIHWVDNTYTWSLNLGEFPSTGFNGTAYFNFLVPLNDAGFAGHTNWRLPIISELQSILIGEGVTFAAGADPPDPASGTNPTGQATTCSASPCIDPDFAAVGGPTASLFYWSASSIAANSLTAWTAGFSSGIVGGFRNKTFNSPARAVRDGSCTN